MVRVSNEELPSSRRVRTAANPSPIPRAKECTALRSPHTLLELTRLPTRYRSTTTYFPYPPHRPRTHRCLVPETPDCPPSTARRHWLRSAVRPTSAPIDLPDPTLSAAPRSATSTRRSLLRREHSVYDRSPGCSRDPYPGGSSSATSCARSTVCRRRQTRVLPRPCPWPYRSTRPSSPSRWAWPKAAFRFAHPVRKRSRVWEPSSR